MAEQRRSGTLVRRDFMKTAGVGALAAGLGIQGERVSAADNLLETATIDSADPRWQPFLADLQGNILSGHGRDHSVHIFAKFGGDSAAVKRWIRSFAQQRITSAKKQADEAVRFRRDRTPGDLVASFAMSAGGYRALGFSLHDMPSDRSFLRGLRPKSEETWDNAFQQEIHAWILLADEKLAALRNAAEQVRQEIAPFTELVHVEEGHRARDKYDRDIEPFGYADNVSQPLFLAHQIAAAKRDGTDKWDPSAPLSLVLAPDPNGPANSFGSYLVVEKLEQNVGGFKKRQRELATHLGIDMGMAGALAIGRFRDGTPLAMQSTPGAITENFNYADDPYGSKCPFHAHIRKTNPRGDTSRLLSVGIPPDEERRHRIVRRSVVYGTQDIEGDPRLTADPTTDIGLLFVCYQGDIGHQFEFIQSQWADQPHFVRQSAGLDPLIGHGKQPSGGQRWPKQWGAKPHDVEPVPFDFSGFVHMKGGGYFFVPSLGFLRRI